MRIRHQLLTIVLLLTTSGSLATAEDWPMWRHDAGRSAASAEQLPAQLSLQWSRQLVAPSMAWPEDPRIHFDAAPEPISAGGLIFVGSSTTDSVTAFNAVTGDVRWQVHADGPVRFAPLVADGQVYFGADDGFIYCVTADTGKLQWRQAARPADRKVIGSERVISVWPVRGGPVLVNGQIYFTVGVWPFEGVLLYNFTTAANQQTPPPFKSRTLTSLTPQGYLAAAGKRLYIPTGRGTSACLDLEAGEFLSLSYSSRGKTDYHVTALGDFIFHGDVIYDVPNKRTLAGEVHRPINGTSGVAGTLGDNLIGLDSQNPKVVEVIDRKGNAQQRLVMPPAWKLSRADLAKAVSESSADWKIHLQAGTLVYGHIGKQLFAIQPGSAETPTTVSWHATIDSAARSMIAANGRLIVVSATNRIYCFADGEIEPRHLPESHKQLAIAGQQDVWAQLAARVIAENPDPEAYCLVTSIGSGELIRQLLRRSTYRLLVVDADAEQVARLRQQTSAAGLYGTRIAIQHGELSSASLPPYFASVIVSEHAIPGDARSVYRSLRPYGGNAYLPADNGAFEQLQAQHQAGQLPGAEFQRSGNLVRITRSGALAGSSNWTHEYGDAANSLTSADELVKAPFGVLWFGGPAADGELFYNRHYWAPSPTIIDGRMFLEGPQVFAAIDVYTGQILWKIELPEGTSPGRRGNFFEKVRVGFHFVASNEFIYLSDGTRCQMINPVTGKIEREIKLPSEEQRWGRMRLVDDLLVATIWEKKDGEDVPAAIAAFDRISGDPYWRHEATVSAPLVAIGNGRVYYFDGALASLFDDWKRKGLVPEAAKYRVLKALDSRTGKPLWQQETDQIVSWIGFSKESDVLISSNKLGIAARSANDGKPLWEKTAEGKGFRGHPENLWDRVILWNDRIIDQRGPGLSYDVKTGEPIKQKHPITGEEVDWQFTKSGHHCNYAIASPHLLTFRAASAGFLDLESGTTGRLEGFRSGCRNSLIPANGVLNAPNLAHGCSCSYNLFTSLALVHVPEAEMWTYSAFEKRDVPVDRVGINLGAPGDRLAAGGTMWLDYPNVGGPSPDVTVQVFPRSGGYFRNHASQVKGAGLQWVAASGCEGLESIIVTTAATKTVSKYTVRLYFSEPQQLKPGERVFDVGLQGETVLESLDVAKLAQGPGNILVREFKDVSCDGQLRVTLKAHKGKTLLCGIEILAQP